MVEAFAPKKGRVLYGGVVVKSRDLQGGWFEDQTFSETVDPFNAHETKTTDYRFLEEPSFYTNRLIEYKENEWYSWLIDQASALLFSSYSFDGPGAEAVQNFFDKTCPDAKDEVMLMGLNVVREGTGALRKLIDGNGSLRQIYHVNGRLIRLKTDDESKFNTGDYSGANPPYEAAMPHSDTSADTEPETKMERIITRMTMAGVDKWYTDFVEWPRKTAADYRNDEIALCRIRRDAWSPYGIGLGSSCFHVIQSMRSMNRDIIASIKRLSASLLVFKGDVSGIEGDANKRAALLSATKAFADLDSATTGVVAIDAKNELTYPDGDAGERIMAIMNLLEPVMSALLLNFLVPLGIVEQTGANKSLIAKQEIRAQKQLRAYQDAVARFFEVQVFPHITDKPCIMSFDTDLDPEFWISFWQTGAVSRERTQEEFNIIDHGKTFSTDLQAAVKKAGMKDSNDDDTSTPGRKGGRSDTSATKAT